MWVWCYVDSTKVLRVYGGCGTLWTVLSACVAMWTVLNGCGTLWTVLSGCVAMWTVLSGCGTLWTVLSGCVAMWTVLSGRGGTSYLGVLGWVNNFRLAVHNAVNRPRFLSWTDLSFAHNSRKPCSLRTGKETCSHIVLPLNCSAE